MTQTPLAHLSGDGLELVFEPLGIFANNSRKQISRDTLGDFFMFYHENVWCVYSSSQF